MVAGARKQRLQQGGSCCGGLAFGVLATLLLLMRAAPVAEGGEIRKGLYFGKC